MLRSAVANAESNPALDWNGDERVVHAIFVERGSDAQRWRARARGRIGRIHKRTCHITVQVAQKEAAASGTESSSRRPAFGVIHDWKSNWMVGKKEFAGALIEDIKIREHIHRKLSHAGLSDIDP